MCIIESTINLICILPAAVSPTADSPSYITESDPKEDLEEEGDEDLKEDPTDYPTDKDDDEEEESSRDDDDDEEEDEDEEEEDEQMNNDSGASRLQSFTSLLVLRPLRIFFEQRIAAIKGYRGGSGG
ncbi:hypothetical protein Tco_0494595 [Tanacetum coccineum]